jgi:hypothetical protein
VGFLALDWLVSNHFGANEPMLDGSDRATPGRQWRGTAAQLAWSAAHATRSSAASALTIRSGSIPARAALSQP